MALSLILTGIALFLAMGVFAVARARAPDAIMRVYAASAVRRSGTANIDFVIFPPRWLVAEDSFRPPWYHT